MGEIKTIFRVRPVFFQSPNNFYYSAAHKDISGLACFLRDTGSMVFIKVGWSQAGMGPLYSGASI